MHSTKTSHVSEKDLLDALSVRQSTSPESFVNGSQCGGGQPISEEGSSQGTNGRQQPKQRLASLFSAWKHWSSKGRASRSEYWFGILVHHLVLLPIAVMVLLWSLDFIVDGNLASPFAFVVSFVASFLPLVCWLFLYLAWTSRRLHDCGNSSWVLLLEFLPFGGLVILFLCLRPSEPRTNRYGEVPYLEP